MKRIAVIGCGGSGKSTLAAKLGEKLNLPVHHLDSFFWKPGWVQTPREEWREIHDRLCADDEWIIDGNYHSTMDKRLEASDTVVFLDLPTRECLLGACRRVLKFYGRDRPDMTRGCRERFDLEFMKWIWNFRKDIRPQVLEKLNVLNGEKRIVVLKSRREIRDFLEQKLGVANSKQQE